MIRIVLEYGPAGMVLHQAHMTAVAFSSRGHHVHERIYPNAGNAYYFRSKLDLTINREDPVGLCLAIYSDDAIEPIQVFAESLDPKQWYELCKLQTAKPSGPDPVLLFQLLELGGVLLTWQTAHFSQYHQYGLICPIRLSAEWVGADWESPDETNGKTTKGGAHELLD